MFEPVQSPNLLFFSDLDQTNIFTGFNDRRTDPRCGIGPTYFADCLRTRELTMRFPTYERCMADRRCVHECVAAQVRRLSSRCAGTDDVNDLSCFDVARIHYGGSTRCLNLNANFYAFFVNSLC